MVGEKRVDRKVFIEELSERIFGTPLPTFPLCFKDGTGVPVLYHFTNKLQYDPIYCVVLKPMLAELFSRIPMVHLLRNGGDLSRDLHRESFKAVIDTYRLTDRGVVVALGNDATELDILDAMRAGVMTPRCYRARLFNANRLLDPTVFSITNGDTRRKYTFCHTARLIPEKRHELLLEALCRLRPLVLSGVVLSAGMDEPVPYRQWLEGQLISAGIAVQTGLSLAEVNQHLNQSFMGLALSEGEGQCTAVGEYLLAGLPTVTIAGARGGRNLYLDEENAVFCELNEYSVADGMESLLKKSPNRQRIRDRFAALCLPRSYWDLQALAGEAACQADMITGRMNKEMKDRLMTYSTLQEWGIDRETVSDLAHGLAMNMNGFVISTAFASAPGVRILVRGLKQAPHLPFNQRGDMVDVTSIRYALWSRDLEEEPTLWLRGERGDSIMVLLDRAGVIHCRLDSITVDAIVHRGG